MKLKKLLSLLASMAMTVAAVTGAMSASAETDSGDCGETGDNITWSFNTETGVLTLSGEGAMDNPDDYMYTTHTQWSYSKYDNQIKEVIVEEGITEIGKCAFGPGRNESSCVYPNLTKVTLPSSLKTIAIAAFKYDNIEEVSFSESLEYIGALAFSNTKIKSINLHEGMTIGLGAFENCESLKKVTIPKNLFFEKYSKGYTMKSTAPITFGNCTGLEEIVIEDGGIVEVNSTTEPPSQNGIVAQFCLNCTTLKTVIIKGNVDYIGNDAFGGLKHTSDEGCPSLTDIYLYNTGLTTVTAKDTQDNAFGIYDSFDITNNPTFHVVKGSTTEQTLIDAGYLNDENTVYIADTTALETAISEAEAIETDNYTDESVSAFTKAIENAKALLDNMDATQDEVDKAVNAITAALSGLAKKSAQSAKPSNDNKITNTKSQAQKNAENAMKQAKITKLTAKSKAKKKITVTWKKVSKANGYQIQVSTNKKFKKSKIILTKTTSKKKITIKKLKSKKTYFVRVRAYATYKDSNGKRQKVYSSWIKKTRKVKVK